MMPNLPVSTRERTERPRASRRARNVDFVHPLNLINSSARLGARRYSNGPTNPTCLSDRDRTIPGLRSTSSKCSHPSRDLQSCARGSKLRKSAKARWLVPGESRAKLSDGRDPVLTLTLGVGGINRLDCRDVPSSHFFFSTGGRPDHCYRIEQERSGGRETTSGATGVGINQVDLTCAAAARGDSMATGARSRHPRLFLDRKRTDRTVH